MRFKKVLPFLLLSLIFFALRAPFLNNEYTFEESLIVRSAQAIASTGYPKIYLHQFKPEFINLWKPPGLIMIIGLFYKFFGVSEIISRLAPLLFSFGQFTLLTIINPLAGLLFAIHPYAIQNSIQIDIDGGVLSFIVIFIILKFYRQVKRNRINLLTFSLLFLISFWVKIEPTLITGAILGIYLFLVKKKKLIPPLIISFALGLLFFLVSFYSYNLSFSQPQNTLMPFKTILSGSGSLFNLNGTILQAGRLITWLIVPVFSLLLYGCALFLFSKKIKHSPFNLLLFIWFSVFIAGYLILGWVGDYPRYFAPALPAIFLFLSQLLPRPKNNQGLNIILLGVLIGTLGLIQPQLLFLDRIQIITQASYLLLAIEVLAFFFLAHRARKFLLGIIIAFWLVLAIHDLKAPYSLTNHYGNYGFKPAGLYLQQNINGPILTLDSIGYYYHGPYYDFNLVFPYQDKVAQIESLIKDKQIKAIALSSQELQIMADYPYLNQLLSIFNNSHQVNFGTIRVVQLN